MVYKNMTKILDSIFFKSKNQTTQFIFIYSNSNLKWILIDDYNIFKDIFQDWKPVVLNSKIKWFLLQLLTRFNFFKSQTLNYSNRFRY